MAGEVSTDSFVKNAHDLIGNADKGEGGIPLTEAEFNTLKGQYTELTSQLFGGIKGYSARSNLCGADPALSTALAKGFDYNWYKETAQAAQLGH